MVMEPILGLGQNLVPNALTVSVKSNQKPQKTSSVRTKCSGENGIAPLTTIGFPCDTHLSNATEN